MPKTKLLYHRQIRSVWNKQKSKRFYCLNDVVKVLTNINDAKNYLKQMRQRDEALARKWRRIVIPIEMDTKGGRQMLMCTDAAGLLLILRDMRSSEKVKLFKLWLKRRKN
jgi:hypothetical protein